MTHAFIINNPFQPTKGMMRFQIEPGQTVRDFKNEQFGPDEFRTPTAIQVNGELLTRAEWDGRTLVDGDAIFVIKNLPQGIELIVIAIIAIVVAVAAVLLMPDPKIPGDQTQSPDSVYTYRGQKNRFRPSEPVEVVYGKVRHWPTFASRPYNIYANNESYQYSLFCLGQGFYDIDEMLLDDTPIGDFDEVEVEIVQPGDEVTLVESNVITSAEVANIELFGPNEPEYTGWTGPFTLNPFAEPIHRITVDVVFPQGLYELTSKGKLGSYGVELLFEYREINAGGGAIGSWETLKSVTVTRNDNTPQRITYSKGVSRGRYEVRGKRITNKSDSTKISAQTRWEYVRGYAKDVGTFPGKTMIAFKALATNNLNDQTAQAFNVRATRKLRTWDAVDGWSATRVATRNPIWSFCDLMRADYGAKLPTSFLDMTSLKALADVCEAKSLWFDWVFDSPMSIWEAATMILRVARTVPIPQGSLITAIRDVPQSYPSGIFNQNNIVKGSITKKLSMFEFQPFDGLKVAYTDPQTWKEKEVTCVLPGRAGTNLERIKLPGCSNRSRAYREGLYIQSRRELQRKTVSFTTGMEGHIPAFLDLISVTHDTLRVGQGGIIVAYNSTTNVMTLSEQVQFATDNVVHKIAIRGDDGAILGTPITVTRGSAPNKVVLASDPDTPLDFSENRNPPLYAFGVADVWAFMGKVISISPKDDATVEITCVNYVPGVYDYEDATIIDATPRAIIRNRSNPTVDVVTLASVPDKDTSLFVDWTPAAGAVSYIVQNSYDAGVTWNNVGNYRQGPIQMNVNPGTVKVRVAPYSLAGSVIYTESGSFVVGSNVAPPNAPTATTQDAFTGLTCRAKWLAATGAEGYTAEVWQPAGIAALRTIDAATALFVDYTHAQFITDGGVTGRALEFRIKAFNAGGDGLALVVAQTNPIPVAPTTLAVGAPTGTDYPATWAHTPEADFKEYRVYASTTSGFTPGPANLIATRYTPSGTIPAPVRPLYWRVAALDVWADDLALSTEAVIP